MPRRAQFPFGILFLAGVWAICHPYEGLVHDAVLYAGQALRHLPATALSGDVFFKAVSQDDYTVFGRVYAALVLRLGLPSAGLALYVFGQLVWFGVAVAWIRTTAPGLALAGVACLLALRYGYGPANALEPAESFVTARLLAEPIALAGLLAGVRGRPAPAVMLLVAALVIHPLAAAPVIGVFGLLVLRERFGAATAVAAVLVASAAVVAAGIAVSPRMDDAWLQAVQARVPGMLPSGWGPDQLAKWAVAIVMLLVAAAAGPARYAGLWRIAALVGVLGIGLAVAALQARWAALVQVQAWRAMWLCVWLAPLAAMAAWRALPDEEKGTRIRVLGLIPAFALAQQSWMPWASAVALGYACMVAVSVRDTRGWFARGDARGAAVFALVLSAAALAGAAMGVVKLAKAAELTGDREVRVFATHCFGWAVAAALAWWAADGRGRSGAGSRHLPLLAGATMLAAALLWDARPPLAREAARLYGGTLAQWQSMISPGAQVLWPDRFRYVWLGLGRSSYVSLEQGAGGLFDRATALETERRLAALQAALQHDARTGGAGEPARTPGDTDPGAVLRRLCGLHPRPDFVVLAAEIPGSLGEPYVERFSGRTYRLYACGGVHGPERVAPSVTVVAPAAGGAR